MKKRKFTVAKIIGIVALVFLFLAMIFNYSIKSFLLSSRTEVFNQQVEESNTEYSNSIEPTYDTDNVTSISEDQILKSMIDKSWTNIIGYIAIPSLNMKLPIFEGLNNANLLYGAGTVKASQQMGERNYLLASHKSYSESLLFTPLLKSSVGDEVYLLDKKSNPYRLYKYVVTEKNVVPPTQSEVMNDTNNPILTLITCNDDQGKERLVVKAELKTSQNFDESSSDILNFLTKK